MRSFVFVKMWSLQNPYVCHIYSTSQIEPVTFQVLNSHMRLMATMLKSTGQIQNMKSLSTLLKNLDYWPLIICKVYSSDECQDYIFSKILRMLMASKNMWTADMEIFVFCCWSISSSQEGKEEKVILQDKRFFTPVPNRGHSELGWTPWRWRIPLPKPRHPE